MAEKQTITINWEGQKSKHIIELDDDYYSGYCLTHSEFVKRYIRCSHFPCQTAMWSDLWDMELKKLD
ncbi:MAG: hypothetical protein WC389_20460 [Lutibacter sp.]|jgi:hypothetical protein